MHATYMYIYIYMNGFGCLMCNIYEYAGVLNCERSLHLGVEFAVRARGKEMNRFAGLRGR